MHSPYRGGPGRGAGDQNHDGSLVEDVVHQFATRFAFFRELIQNSLDAGTTEILVRLQWSAEEGGVMVVDVTDDGFGMDRDTVENKLLVLFRSGKEGRTDTIGKFGIGFVSILAMKPLEVIVETKAEKTRALTLQLFADHSYELFENPAASTRGTTVRLRIALPEDSVLGFVQEAEEALRKWCGHAPVPIRFSAYVGADATPLRSEEVTTEMSLPNALVSVRFVSKDKRSRGVMGLVGPGATGTYYKRGLALEESESHLPGVAFKVTDDRLEHTLSRDSVRRTSAWKGLQKLTLQKAEEALAARVTLAMQKAGADEYKAILNALLESHARFLPVGQYPVPLCPKRSEESERKKLNREFAGARTVERFASKPNALTEGLAAQGLDVADLEYMGISVDQARKILGHPTLLTNVDHSLTYYEECYADELQEWVLTRASEVLGEVWRAPVSPRYCDVYGHLANFVAIGASGDSGVVDEYSNPTRLVMRPPLRVNRLHWLVRQCFKHAETDREFAAHALARGILASVPAGEILGANLSPAISRELAESSVRASLSAGAGAAVSGAAIDGERT